MIRIAITNGTGMWTARNQGTENFGTRERQNPKGRFKIKTAIPASSNVFMGVYSIKDIPRCENMLKGPGHPGEGYSWLGSDERVKLSPS